MARKLGVDLGRKSCGFAISDPNNTYSLSLKSISFERDNFKVVTAEIKRLISDYSLDAVILGLPLREFGEEGLWAKRIAAYAEELGEEIKLPVILFDERNSTKETQRVLIELGVKRRGRREGRDRAAAAQILQDYLNSTTDLLDKDKRVNN